MNASKDLMCHLLKSYIFSATRLSPWLDLQSWLPPAVPVAVRSGISWSEFSPDPCHQLQGGKGNGRKAIENINLRQSSRSWKAPVQTCPKKYQLTSIMSIPWQHFAVFTELSLYGCFIFKVKHIEVYKMCIKLHVPALLLYDCATYPVCHQGAPVFLATVTMPTHAADVASDQPRSPQGLHYVHQQMDSSRFAWQQTLSHSSSCLYQRQGYSYLFIFIPLLLKF